MVRGCDEDPGRLIAAADYLNAARAAAMLLPVAVLATSCSTSAPESWTEVGIGLAILTAVLGVAAALRSGRTRP